MHPNIKDTLELMRAAWATPLRAGRDEASKAWTTGTGLVNYDLQRPALALYPWGQMITPLRAELPRVVSREGDTATRWKAITGVNTTQLPPGLSEGNRGGVITSTLATFTAPYVGLGLEDYVSFEADYAAEGFDDAKARSVEGLLRSLMISEEKMIVGGNSSVALGTTGTPTAAGATTGGALTDATYYVGCVALTHDGWSRATVATGVVQTIARTNADATSDTINGGTAAPSAQATGVVLNAGTAVQRVNASVTAIKGAVAYAWYLGTSAAHLYLQQITTINSVNFTTALVTTTQDFVALAAADYSKDLTYSFDGLLYQGPYTASTGSYFKSLATGTNGTGTALTSDSAGGVVEINTAFQSFWDLYRLSPDTIWVNSQEAQSINKLVIAGGGTPLFRYEMDAGTSNMGIIGGVIVASLINKFTQQAVRLRIHPNMPPGTILMTSKTIPYPLSGVGNVAQMKCRREYYQTEWPLKTRKYEYGVYVDEVLQIYFLPAFGVITNIAPT